MTNDGEDEARPAEAAELFTLPLDFIDTGGLDKAAPLGDYLLGNIKDQIIDGYVGDPAHSAAVEGNEHYESARRPPGPVVLLDRERRERHGADQQRHGGHGWTGRRLAV